jgi:dTDP-4-dehydrorhamnose reductase
VVESAGLSPEVVSAISSTDFERDAGIGSRAARPAYSVLGHEKLHAHGIEAIGPWEERWQAASSAVLVVEETE